MGYGFDQPPGPSFPVEPKPDYLSSVRLFINPVPSSDSKTQRMVRYVTTLCMQYFIDTPKRQFQETSEEKQIVLVNERLTDVDSTYMVLPQ